MPPVQDEGQASSKDRAFYSDEEDENKAKNEAAGMTEYSMEADHRLLLTATAPLLNSRNAGVRPRAPTALRARPCAMGTAVCSVPRLAIRDPPYASPPAVSCRVLTGRMRFPSTPRSRPSRRSGHRSSWPWR